MRTRTMIECGYCGKAKVILLAEFKRQKKKGRELFYCSLSCAGRMANGPRRKSLVGKVCPLCDDVFTTKWGKTGATFCSRSCASRGSSRIGPYKYKAVKIDGKVMLAHRFIMEKHLGRLLAEGEIVHHIDGDGRNNVINNLKVMTLVDHAIMHRKEQLGGEKESTGC